MIHQVVLPEFTRTHLEEIVGLQIWVLRYAAQDKPVIDEKHCAAYLEEIPKYRGRGEALANWVLKHRKTKANTSGKTTKKSRYELLKQFAKGPIDTKGKLVRQVGTDIRLFSRGRGSISPLVTAKNADQAIQDCQEAASEFLRHFYDDLNELKGFPSDLFPDAKPFTRQAFLNAFLSANNELFVCAVCDESGYYATSADGSVRTDIDHYLPKSLYPYLACHPHNLIPICHPCNSFIKRDVDPLKHTNGARRKLEDILLPYREESGFDTRTYIQINPQQSPNPPIEFTAFKLKESNLDFRHRIEALGEVYELPLRWNRRVDQIGETLFRRIYQFLRDGQGIIPVGDNMPQALTETLDHLLYFMHEKEKGDQGKDPFAFAMTWWLAHILNEEIEPVVTKNPKKPMIKPAFLQEIESWLVGPEANVTELAQRIKIAKELRVIAKRSPQLPGVSAQPTPVMPLGIEADLNE